MRTPDYVVTDAETPYYLTTGKHYPVINDEDADGDLLVITDDEGENAIVLPRGCAHINAPWRKGYTVHMNQIKREVKNED